MTVENILAIIEGKIIAYEEITKSYGLKQKTGEKYLIKLAELENLKKEILERCEK